MKIRRQKLNNFKVLKEKKYFTPNFYTQQNYTSKYKDILDLKQTKNW